MVLHRPKPRPAQLATSWLPEQPSEREEFYRTRLLEVLRDGDG